MNCNAKSLLKKIKKNNDLIKRLDAQIQENKKIIDELNKENGNDKDPNKSNL